MKAASKVFLIIGLVSSIIIFFYSLFFGFAVGMFGVPAIFSWLFFVYSIYGIVTSIGGLKAVSGYSKKAITVWAILYIPVVLLATLFMTCIDERDLY